MNQLTETSPLRIVFAGTPEFAARHLDTLLHSPHQVVAVYTQPDRQAGRGRKLTSGPVKVLAEQHNLPVYQPETLKSTEAQQQLKQLNADIMVVVAYGLLLPEAILNTPRLGCINVHASLLPLWRGAAPIQRSILAGDSETGITIMQMDKGLDTGDILGSVQCPVNADETGGSLHDKLLSLGCQLLPEILHKLSIGNISRILQNNQHASYASKLNKAEAAINWQQSCAQIDRQIRAFNPWPYAWTYWQNKSLRILLAHLLPHTHTECNTEISHLPAGSIVQTSRDGIDVQTGDGILRITRIQPAGKRAMHVRDFLNAHDLSSQVFHSQ